MSQTGKKESEIYLNFSPNNKFLKSYEEALQYLCCSQSDLKSYLHNFQQDFKTCHPSLCDALGLLQYYRSNFLCDVHVFPVLKAFGKLEITIHSEWCNLEKDVNICTNEMKDSKIKVISLHRKTQWMENRFRMKFVFIFNFKEIEIFSRQCCWQHNGKNWKY